MKYPYICDTCSSQFYFDHPLSEVVNAAKIPKVKCPVCHKTARRVMVVPAVHFKGAGFYSVDNKKEKNND